MMILNQKHHKKPTITTNIVENLDSGGSPAHKPNPEVASPSKASIFNANNNKSPKKDKKDEINHRLQLSNLKNFQLQNSDFVSSLSPKENLMVDKKDVIIVKKLGEGGEGSVFLGNYKGPGSVAVKIIECNSREGLESTRKELSIIFHLQHKNVVKHIGYWEENYKVFFEERTRFYVVMEYVGGGSLEDVIVDKNKKLSKEYVLDIFIQLCECLKYLHKKRIIHRDIKPQNILLDEDKNSVKLCDFGLTTQFDSSLNQTVLGTIFYSLKEFFFISFDFHSKNCPKVAPEISARKHYDSSIDIWSLGVVLLQMILRISQEKLPDLKEKIIHDHEFIRKLLSKYNCGEPFVTLAENCLAFDPVERPTAEEILLYISNPKLHPLSTKNTTSFSKSYEDQESANPAVHIKNEKGRFFWVSNNWGPKVGWLEFREGYLQFTGWKVFTHPQSRSLKKLLCSSIPAKQNSSNLEQNPQQNLNSNEKKNSDVKNTDEFVHCIQFEKAIGKYGFPFDIDSLSLLISGLEISGNKSAIQAEYHLDSLRNEMKGEDLIEKTRIKYLRLLLNREEFFLDPISLEKVNFEKASQFFLQISRIPQPEKEFLLKNEIDFDYLNEYPEISNSTTTEKFQGFQNRNHCDNSMSPTEMLEASEIPIRAIILGPSAAGKTVSLKMILFMMAKALLQESTNPKNNNNAVKGNLKFLAAGLGFGGGLIPIYVPICKLSFPNHLNFQSDFILQCIRASANALLLVNTKNGASEKQNGNLAAFSKDIEQFLYNAIQSKKALLLFDGLDEADSIEFRRFVQHSIVSLDENEQQTTNSNSNNSSNPNSTTKTTPRGGREKTIDSEQLTNNKKVMHRRSISKSDDYFTKFHISKKSNIIITSRISNFETDFEGNPLLSDFEFLKMESPNLKGISENCFDNQQISEKFLLFFTKTVETKKNANNSPQKASKGSNNPAEDSNSDSECHENEKKKEYFASSPLFVNLIVQLLKHDVDISGVRRGLIYDLSINWVLNHFIMRTNQETDLVKFHSTNETTAKDSENSNENGKFEERVEKLTVELKQFLRVLAVYMQDSKKRRISSEEIENSKFFSNYFKTYWKTQIVPFVKNHLFPLISDENNYFRFRHLIFQDYFCASVWFDERCLSIVRKTPSFFLGSYTYSSKMIKKLIFDDDYKEIFLILGSLATKQDFLKLLQVILKNLGKKEISNALIKPILFQMIEERPEEEDSSIYFSILKKKNIS